MLACLLASFAEAEEKFDFFFFAAGGRRLGVCSGGDMLKPGYREVFMKYCRRKGGDDR